MKLCTADGCKGAKVTGSNWTRHLREVHKFNDSQVKAWRTLLAGKYQDIAPPSFAQSILNQSEVNSMKGKLRIIKPL